MILKYSDTINRCWYIEEFIMLSKNEQELVLHDINQYLDSLTAEDRLIWANQYLPKQSILSSSFGLHSSVSLHLVTRYYPGIPVVLIDTGYLFPETYLFIDQLVKKMQLNLHVFRSYKSPAWQEACYGKLWNQGIQGIQKYNFINKIEPMQRALKKLEVNTWFAGLRRSQSNSRKNLPIISVQNGIFKFLPIIDWDECKVLKYMKKYNLEHHPLWNQGYVSLGDIHTTSKKTSDMIHDEDTRFFGLQRECGLHFFK